ncbi:glycogen debranching N-terminal domain-containing protein [Methanosarcina sp.]|uniref:amylo-alpha-1,6-glucosidase n=1 Tax=Methanosarcina sp. TaxID=2213 RepID=UPI002ABA4703|nr:glycogen debranching N-terminal domain-containing protein [Methanosarcina sp.]MDY9925691.1 glycogen debranching N-terminal domain-containing protein [Methanosarcina sp.]
MTYQTKSEIRIVNGETFIISDAVGNIHQENTGNFGFFFRDTRFLSELILKINDQDLSILSAKEINYFWSTHYATLPFESIFEAHPITIIRKRAAGNGAREEIIIHNYKTEPVDLTLSIQLDADFVDIIELKRAQGAEGKPVIEINSEENQHIFVYQVNGMCRKTIIQCEAGAQIENKKVSFKINIPAKDVWKTCLTIRPVWEDQVKEPEYLCEDLDKNKPVIHKPLQQWKNQVPRLTGHCSILSKTYEHSLMDLAALRFYIDSENKPVIAAGMPWYMALFGRDSLITAYQCCFIAPDIAFTTLRNLARLQGKEYNDFRDEEPGKILHELRFGEKTLLGEKPYSPYFGTADSCQLFLILLHEAFKWTGNRELVNELKEPALKALNWIDNYGDMDGDGYIEYQKRSKEGLGNHCWKDSGTSMIFSDASLAEAPIATVEFQGYVYDAKLRLAELAEEVWNDSSLAEKLRNQAKELKRHFNKDFWIEDRGGYFALGLDKNKKKIDSMTSNMGHLLWSGIVNDDKADIIVKQLMSSHLYSGWGIRTLSVQDRGYNPIEYHNGTIWPHDNSLIAEGLIKYGYKDEANQIIINLLEASQYFDNRFPEVFAGYQRTEVDFPVPYPTSSSPQAWAAGASVLFLRMILGLEPDHKNQNIIINPYLPAAIEDICVENVRLFNKNFSICVQKDHSEVELSD